MLFVHWARRAASRAAWTAGKRSEINTAMMAMTTRSSISVKPRFAVEGARLVSKRMRMLLETNVLPARDGAGRTFSIDRRTGNGSVRVVTENLSLGDRAERPDRGIGSRVLEVANRTVQHGDVGAARVEAGQA